MLVLEGRTLAASIVGATQVRAWGRGPPRACSARNHQANAFVGQQLRCNCPFPSSGNPLSLRRGPFRESHWTPSQWVSPYLRSSRASFSRGKRARWHNILVIPLFCMRRTRGDWTLSKASLTDGGLPDIHSWQGAGQGSRGKACSRACCGGGARAGACLLRPLTPLPPPLLHRRQRLRLSRFEGCPDGCCTFFCHA